MSTRGVLGLFSGGVTKATYNHSDSYPTGLGKDTAEELTEALKTIGIDKMRSNFKKIKMIKDEDKQPSNTDIKKYNDYANTHVGGPMSNDVVLTWYQLLRETQGTLMPYYKGEVVHMIDGKSFIGSGLYCEWVYIVNLDTEELEVYKGFQRVKHNEGRYANMRGYKAYDGTQYYPAKLIRTYPFDNLPKENEWKIREEEEDNEQEKV